MNRFEIGLSIFALAVTTSCAGTTSDSSAAYSSEVGQEASVDGYSSHTARDCTGCLAPTRICCVTPDGPICVANSEACPAATKNVVACVDTGRCGNGSMCCQDGLGDIGCVSICGGGHQVCVSATNCGLATPVCDLSALGMNFGYGLCSAQTMADGGERLSDGGTFLMDGAGG